MAKKLYNSSASKRSQVFRHQTGVRRPGIDSRFGASLPFATSSSLELCHCFPALCLGRI